MANNLMDKHKLVSQFAVMAYKSPQSAEQLKIKHRFVPEEESPAILLQNILNNGGPVVGEIFMEKDRDRVMELCNANPELCADSRLDPVWKKKIEQECRNKFRGSNLWKYKDIEEFNQDHRSNFKNFFHIFQLCKLIPGKKDELIEHVFANDNPQVGNSFNYIQIAGFTESGKGLIVRKIPSLIVNIPGGKPLIRPNMDWVVNHPIVTMKKLPREVERRFPDYTHIQINGIIESKINKQGFREWWFEARGKGKGNYDLIIDYY